MSNKFVEINEKIADNVVKGYKKIEDGVVGGYKKIEEGVVSGFEKVSDKAIETFFAKEGETPEETKARLRSNVPETETDTNNEEENN